MSTDVPVAGTAPGSRPGLSSMEDSCEPNAALTEGGLVVVGVRMTWPFVTHASNE